MEATMTDRMVELTATEKRRLKRSLLGYGKLVKAAEEANVHFNTLRNISRLGYGERKTIEKIRATILAA